MKSRITVMLALLPMLVHAQISQVTASQKQQALQHVQSFCSLLSQWSNGQRTLDTRIYALCSGNDCSAYDDVSTKKETTMRNYLLGIQKKYPKSLSMQITQPTLSDCEITYEPELTFATRIGSVTNDMDPLSSTEITELFAESYKNAYLIFKVRQSIPSLSINANKLIVYDLNARKITAYITGSGTFISYLDGLNLMVKRDYKRAIPKFEAAAVNPRGSLKSSCNLYAMMCCAYLGDTSSLIRYGKASNVPVVSKYCDILQYLMANSYAECLAAVKDCERLIQQDSNGRGFLPGVYYMGGLICSMSGESTYNPAKSVEYFRKGIKAGNVLSAYMLFEAFLHDDNFDDYISGDEVMEHLKWAAEKGHTGAILMEGKMTEASQNDVNEAIRWYEKGAKLGDTFCMACLGKLLVTKGGSNVSVGRRWLQKALEGDAFDRQTEAYKDLINDKFWPRSRSDVQAVLNGSAATSVSPSPSPSSPSTPSASSSSSSSSSSYSSSSYSGNYTYTPRYHKPFNHKLDNYWGGLSIGYIQKQWTVEQDGEKEKMGVFDDDKFLKGVQVGLRVDPQFGLGFGMNSGLFYEYCWAKSDDQYDGYGSYHMTYEEHGLYLPLHLKFTMNFHTWFQLSFYGGAGFNYILSGNVYMRDDGETLGSQDMFDSDGWKKFNTMLEYGVSIRLADAQFDFSMSKGLTNWSSGEDYKTTQGRAMNLSMTICF